MNRQDCGKEEIYQNLCMSKKSYSYALDSYSSYPVKYARLKVDDLKIKC